MLSNKTRTCMLVVLALAGLLLVACGGRYSSLKVGWVGSSTPDQIAYRYQRFSGIERKTFRAKAGETLLLDYEVEVETGSLMLRLMGPDGETRWERVLEEDVDDRLTVTLEKGGRYRLEIEGDDSRGAFDLEWEVS